MNLLNDVDPYAVHWCQRLVEAGVLPDDLDTCLGDVRELIPDDVGDYRPQVHLFGGIGGWPIALGLAGWPTDRPVWTASLPCQPFSNAGQRKAERDDRHLWPATRKLVAKRRPPVIFGEQVAPILGRRWMLAVREDLMALGYRVAVLGVPASLFGAPHPRLRLFWVAERDDQPTREEPPVAPAADFEPMWMRPRWLGDPEVEWAICNDLGLRPVEKGCWPSGKWRESSRRGTITGYGNAIVPQVGAWFIRAYMARRVVAPTFRGVDSQYLSDWMEVALSEQLARAWNPLTCFKLTYRDGILHVVATVRRNVNRLRVWPTVVGNDHLTPWVTEGWNLALRTQAVNITDSVPVVWATPVARSWNTGAHIPPVLRGNPTNRERSLAGKGMLDLQCVGAGVLPRDAAIRHLREHLSDDREPLTPDFCRWLMGYSPEHLRAAPGRKEAS